MYQSKCETDQVMHVLSFDCPPLCIIVVLLDGNPYKNRRFSEIVSDLIFLAKTTLTRWVFRSANFTLHIVSVPDVVTVRCVMTVATTTMDKQR